ncbi:MAG: BON domain-containing protein [Gammaproteobacteria bacterium]|nr:BON domain-containing protein [Gammaproteobacteria bacterium]
MKFKNPIAVGLLTAILGLSLVGCAATPTQESTGQYVDSSTITTKVKSALVATKGIDSTDINVETYKGTVQLSGFVNTQAQKVLAEKTAKQVKGVNQVVDNIVVKSSS